jgi:DNA-directed RNA polymerase subunit L
MEKLSDIKLKLIRHNKDKVNSRYEINIKGKDINEVIINTIRRAILTYVPIYAFTKFNFTINESVFNNNYIKLRLQNLPVWNINNNIIKLENKKINETIIENNEEEINIDDDVDLNDDNNVNSSSLSQLTMYVDYKSSDKGIFTVTSDHAKFYYDGKSISSPYHIPIPIIKLQPEQSIKFSAITTIGTEKENSIYSAVSVCFYKQNDTNDYNFIVESRGQLTEQRIMEVAMLNIISNIENILELIPETQISATGEIIMNNENNTMGNLLCNGLQKHKHIKNAGYNMPHPLEEKIIIYYELIDDKYKIKDVISDVIIYLSELFRQIIKLNK